MAVPNSKTTLKEYCLRALGKPVIEINVDAEQVDDRIDEAVQYFSQYHYDGVERMYMKYQITEADVTRARSNESVGTGTEGSVSNNFLNQQNYIVMPSSVLSVMGIFNFNDKSNLNMFDIRYQMRLNDLYDFSSTSILHYEMTMRHLDFLDHILIGEKPVAFNMHNNRLYIGMDWANDVQPGEFIIVECYRKLDPTTYTDIYDDMFLKRYTTALIKQQWGANLSKFQGVTMLGGVSMNGAEIYSQALSEKNKLEEEIRSTFEAPISYMIG
jgi:hypothetical protein|tara:strand:- start:714 stop:1523 length:810 start_codon:yes stop_codon:yes gene_type:complete